MTISACDTVGSRLGPVGYRNDCKVRGPIQSLAISDCNLCPGRRRAGSSSAVVLQPISTVPLHLFVRTEESAAILRGKLPCVTSHHRVSGLRADETQRCRDIVVVASRQWAEDLVLRGVPSNRIIRLAYDVDREPFSLLTEIAGRHIWEKVLSACVAPQGRRVGQQFVPPQVFIREDSCCRRRSIVLARHSDSSRRPCRDSRFGGPILSRLTFATACAAERFSFRA